jgi:hypothetical protein
MNKLTTKEEEVMERSYDKPKNDPNMLSTDGC